MQKTSLKASILIWSIFLSLIISVAFIWISTQIHKKFKSNNEIRINKTEQKAIDKKLSEKDYTSETLNPDQNIIFEQSGYYNLQKSETITFSFTGSTLIQITPLENSILSLDNWGIKTLISSTYSQSNLNGNIKITWLSGHSRFQLLSNSNYKQESYNYKIVETIWNKEVIQSYGTIQ